MKLKKRKGKNYIVIGTIHLGFDVDVLRAINTVAKFYNAEIVHSGPLADRTEVDMYNRRVRKLKSFEKNKIQTIKNKVEKLNLRIEGLENVKQGFINDYKKLPKTKKYKKDRSDINCNISDINERISDLKKEESLCWERMNNDHDRLKTECDELLNAQRYRLDYLLSIFDGSKVHIVSNKGLMIPDSEWILKSFGNFYHEKQFELSRHLYITSIPANGDKISGQPITQRTFRMLRNMGHSHIIPHMTPQTKPFPRPGLNQAFNYVTTGAIQFCDKPNKITEAFKSSSRASCILVTMDSENGEFHQQRLRIKKFRDDSSHTKKAHIMHDGLVFNSNGEYWALESEDKAVSYTDAHAPHTHEGVVAAIRAINELHNPSVLIDGGDMGNMESVSRFTKHKPGDRENLRIIDDLIAIRLLWNAVGSEIDFPSIKTKVAVGSNHMDWITNFVAENPSLKGILDIETISKTMFPDWEMLLREKSDDQGFIFGDLRIKHGDDEGSIMVAGDIYGNYLGGHDHSFSEFLDAIKTGPASKVDHRIHKYLKNKTTSWQNSVTTISKFRNITCKHPRIVLHSEDEQKSRFSYRGQIYEVDYYFLYNKNKFKVSYNGNHICEVQFE